MDCSSFDGGRERRRCRHDQHSSCDLAGGKGLVSEVALCIERYPLVFAIADQSSVPTTVRSMQEFVSRRRRTSCHICLEHLKNADR